MPLIRSNLAQSGGLNLSGVSGAFDASSAALSISCQVGDIIFVACSLIAALSDSNPSVSGADIIDRFEFVNAKGALLLKATSTTVTLTPTSSGTFTYAVYR